ncbi:hypothetical protein LCGC14_1763950 [marine sediment metagenome]|uniref:Glycosyltransferase 2-like domain-containing protein n=1 Tax=marine sediment metagenome TaxID=412755 RepID=A0A0F9H083_9ZZZZ
MLWSILICAIPERFHTAQGLLHSLLETQSVARRPDVELLYFLDNRRRTVGAKRNDLLQMAKGEYLSFIDDDDEVATDYVDRVLGMIIKTRRAAQVDPYNSLADVICFPQRAILQPANITHECTYSLQHWKEREPEKRRKLEQIPDGKGGVTPNTLAWSGPPAHTMLWRREVVQGIKFPEKQFGEDVDWVDQACEKAKTELVLNGAPLYFYKFDERKTATR